jgi:signal transduction histidine kinase
MNRPTSFEMPRTESPPARLTVWDYFFRALVVLSLLLFVALAWDLLAHPDAVTFSTPPSPLWYHAVFGFVILPLWWLVSVLILWRAPGNLVGRFLLLMMIGALGWQFTFDIGSPEFASTVFLLFLFYWGAIGFPSLVYLLMVFPDGKLFPSRWHPWVLLFAFAKVLGAILELMSIRPSARIFNPTVTSNPFFLPALAQYQNGLTATVGAVGPLILLGVMMGVASLVLRYRSSSTRVQQQIKWLLWWAVIFVLMMPLYYLILFGIRIGSVKFTTLIPLLLYFNLGGLLIAAIGIAILRYRLFDIDLILNRTLVYGALIGVVVSAYVLIVGLISAQFQSSQSPVIAILATGLVALLFNPLRQRLQHGVNHLMYGERDDPYAVLSQLGQRLETVLAPNAILPMIVETIGHALKLPFVEIHLSDDKAGSVSFGEPQATTIAFPLAYQNESVGELHVAPRAGESLSLADRNLLKDLARQTGIAIHTARITVDLQRSRERLVLAREEERRRLRRDLHDDLAPTLASLGLTASTAADLIPTNPTTATKLVKELQTEIRSTVGNIRRLVYDLRPPTLDELGLLAAIRERAAQYSNAPDRFHVTVDAPAELPMLPAAVEVAAYRIVQEALENVSKHSQARQCTIRFANHNGLEIEITDDGIGLPPNINPGVGLRSMRERAEELGGTCVIEREVNSGTRVLARLPIGDANGSVTRPDRG